MSRLQPKNSQFMFLLRASGSCDTPRMPSLHLFLGSLARKLHTIKSHCTQSHFLRRFFQTGSIFKNNGGRTPISVKIINFVTRSYFTKRQIVWAWYLAHNQALESVWSKVGGFHAQELERQCKEFCRWPRFENSMLQTRILNHPKIAA